MKTLKIKIIETLDMCKYNILRLTFYKSRCNDENSYECTKTHFINLKQKSKLIFLCAYLGNYLKYTDYSVFKLKSK